MRKNTRNTVRLNVECLEGREVPANYFWTANNGWDATSFTVNGQQAQALPTWSDTVIINDNSPVGTLQLNINQTIGRLYMTGQFRGFGVSNNCRLTIDPDPNATFDAAYPNQMGASNHFSMGQGSILALYGAQTVFTTYGSSFCGGGNVGSVYVANNATLNMAITLPVMSSHLYVGSDPLAGNSTGTVYVGYSGGGITVPQSNLSMQNGADISISETGSMLLVGTDPLDGQRGGIAGGAGSTVENYGYLGILAGQTNANDRLWFVPPLNNYGTVDIQKQGGGVPLTVHFAAATGSVVVKNGGDLNLLGDVTILVTDRIKVESGGRLNVDNNWALYAEIKRVNQTHVNTVDVYGGLHISGRLRVSSTVQANSSNVNFYEGSNTYILLTPAHPSGLGVSGSVWFDVGTNLTIEDTWSSGTPPNYGILVCYDGGGLTGVGDWNTVDFSGYWTWSSWGPNAQGTAWVLYA